MPERVIQAAPEDFAPLRRLDSALVQAGVYAADSGDETTTPQLVVDGDTVEIPRSAYEALAEVVQALAQGKRIMLVADGAEMTTQEAADMLSVSRPHLVKMIDNGEIPAHMVGSHRRLMVEDVLDYRRRRAQQRQAAIDEIARMSLDDEGEYR